MTAFIWQSLLLLGLAYALGCWIACLLRRMVSVSERTAMPADAVPAAAIAGAAAAGAAVRQAPPVPTPRIVRPPAATPAPVRDAFRRADTLEPGPESARPRPLTATPIAQRASPPSASVDRFERALTRAHGPGDGLAAASVVPVPARPVGAGRGANDLTRIRKIDANLEAALHKLGVRTFAEIGAWKSADVTRVSQALGFKGRIEQENWIEQAQILASGRETYYSSRLGLAQAAAQPAAIDHRPPAATGVPAAPPPIRPAAPSGAASSPRGGVEVATATAAAMAAAAAAARVVPSGGPSTAAATTPPVKPAPAAASVAPVEQQVPNNARPAVPVRDDLKRIQGVTSDIEKLLNSHGITRFSQVARWREADTARFGGLLGQPARIQRENWIAQAARLEHTSGQASDAGKAPQPTTGVAAPPLPVPSAPVQSAPIAKPASQPGSVQPGSVTSAGPAPAPAGGAPPQPPPAQKPPVQPATSSVPSTKPAVPPPSPVKPSDAGLDATKPSPTPAPAPAGGAREQAPAAQKPTEQPVVPSVPLTTPVASPPSPAQPGAAGPDAPKPSPTSAPVGSPPEQAPPAQKHPVQPVASSVPVTKPAPNSLPTSLAPGAVASATVAGAAVASLAVAIEGVAAARRSESGAPERPAPDASQNAPVAGAPASPPAPPPPGGPVRETSSSEPQPDAEQSRGELGHLRSVRSEGLRGFQSPLESRSGGGGMDDLKRIRGIGVLIEKKLNSMGVTRYEQIAKWTVTDIDRVSHVLDFKGRIERENWVEQARILASGGQTEFSRRADRGEFGGL